MNIAPKSFQNVKRLLKTSQMSKKKNQKQKTAMFT
jgi:hypothetical protein